MEELPIPLKAKADRENPATSWEIEWKSRKKSDQSGISYEFICHMNSYVGFDLPGENPFKWIKWMMTGASDDILLWILGVLVETLAHEP